jgi:hypothetical protein
VLPVVINKAAKAIRFRINKQVFPIRAIEWVFDDQRYAFKLRQSVSQK